ncbi:hypothetical protein G7039_37185 [Rhizobium leguminosarum]|nr:hypothetical protein G7039_37185 [Rhizobium leguminosarum]
MPPAAAGPIRSTITGPRRRRSTGGDAVSDTLSVSSLDGTASHNIVVAITGANDAASIVVDATVTDDRATVEAGAAGSGDPNASGKLTVSDVDDGEAAFAAPASPQRHLWQLHLQCRQRQLDLYARQ